jgi:hypothetical protein
MLYYCPDMSDNVLDRKKSCCYKYVGRIIPSVIKYKQNNRWVHKVTDRGGWANWTIEESDAITLNLNHTNNEDNCLLVYNAV